MEFRRKTLSTTMLGVTFTFGISLLAANLAGTWIGRLELKAAGRPETVRDVSLTLRGDGSKLIGTFSGTSSVHSERTEILDGTVSGEVIRFKIATGSSDMPRMKFEGRLDGDNLKLEISGSGPNGQEIMLGKCLLKRRK